MFKNSFMFDYLYGRALLDAKEPALAEEMLKKSLKQAPDFLWAWKKLAEAQAAQKHFKDAEASMEKVIKLAEKHHAEPTALAEYYRDLSSYYKDEAVTLKNQGEKPNSKKVLAKH
ncbi:MAG UNVERIFIED_CONTAM: tetratricopeptide repeat protein [Rickettsiaceae bacterium]